MSVLAAACYQAASFVGVERFSPPVQGLLRTFSSRIEPYRDDRRIVADHLGEIDAVVRQQALDDVVPLQL